MANMNEFQKVNNGGCNPNPGFNHPMNNYAYNSRDFLILNSMFNNANINNMNNMNVNQDFPRYYTPNEDNPWESNVFTPLMRATDGAWKASNYQLPK